MGSRHNRKRTRSRPRNRKGLSVVSTYPQMMMSGSSALPSPYSSPFASAFEAPIPTLPMLVHPQWQQRVHLLQNPQQQQQQLHQQQQQQRQRQQKLESDRHAAAIEGERLRMFGGEKGDSVSLCAPMLQVVMDLFEGNVDYEDP